MPSSQKQTWLLPMASIREEGELVQQYGTLVLQNEKLWRSVTQWHECVTTEKERLTGYICYKYFIIKIIFENHLMDKSLHI